MEAQEIERLQREHGSAAFEAGEIGRGKRTRGALLLRRMRPSGEGVIELSEEASRALAERESQHGFRRLIRDDDGVQREYLIKRLRTPSGHLEIRLTWYGMAWPLVNDAVEYQQSRLSALNVQSSLRHPSLFEELDEERRAALNGQLRQMESIRDARLVMDLILRSFGRDGENPLHIPAWQLRALLECENDDNGFRRVEGCLRALQEVRFHVQTEQPRTRRSVRVLWAVYRRRKVHRTRAGQAHRRGLLSARFARHHWLLASVQHRPIQSRQYRASTDL
jgi:hypothetical protein